MSFRRVVFIDGDEGREIVDRLTNTEGVVMRGATAETIAATIEHLSQWDNETGEVTDDLGAGLHDRREDCDCGCGYVLTWHPGLGYVALAVNLDTTPGEPS